MIDLSKLDNNKSYEEWELLTRLKLDKLTLEDEDFLNQNWWFPHYHTGDWEHISSWSDSMKNTVILGIDPGTATVGWGVIEVTEGGYAALGYGTIKTSKNIHQPRRLSQIFLEIIKICNDYNVDQAAVEELFFTKNVSTAISVAESRGAIQTALYRAGDIPTFNYKPNSVKKVLTGSGKAKKGVVMAAVKDLLGLPDIKPDDASDALAIAITHIEQNIGGNDE